MASPTRFDLRDQKALREELQEKMNVLYDDIDGIKRGKTELTSPADKVVDMATHVEGLFTPVPEGFLKKPRKAPAVEGAASRVACHNTDFEAHVKGRKHVESDPRNIVAKKLAPTWDPGMGNKNKLTGAASSSCGKDAPAPKPAEDNKRVALQKKKEAEAARLPKPQKAHKEPDCAPKQTKLPKGYVPRAAEEGPKMVTPKHEYTKDVAGRAH